MISKTKFFSLPYLLLVVASEYVGLAVIIVTAPHLILSENSPFLWDSAIEAKIWFGIYLAAQPLGQLFGAAYFGKLSDCIGRKKTLLITLGFSALSYGGTIVSIFFSNFMCLLLTRLIAGFCAGNVAVAQAAATDLVSNDNEKTHYMSLLQGSIGISWVVGTLIAGGLSELYWFKHAILLPIAFSAFLFLLIFILTCFFEETKMTRNDELTFKFLSILKAPLVEFSSGKYRKLLFMWLFFVLGWWLSEGMLPAFLFVKFKLSNPQIGDFLAYMGILFALFQFFLVQKVAKKMDADAMAKYAFFTGISVFSLIFVSETSYLYLIITFYVLSIAIAIPGMITTISSNSGEQQGEIMGIVSSIQALAIIIAMSLGGLFMSVNVNIIFIAGAVLFIASVLLI